MSLIRRSTENPQKEQWQLLSQFAYTSNIERYLRQKGFDNIDNSIVELIAGSIQQAEAFFISAGNAPIDISPLLLYYGTTNLLTGGYSLLTNTRPPIENHGMVIPDVAGNQIADVRVLPRNPTKGALQIFCDAFSDSCQITNGDSWTMLEILGSIPDLKHDFESHYRDALCYTAPVEIVITRQRSFERIHNVELQRYPNIADALAKIPNFSRTYLPPQFKSDYIILHRKRGGVEIGTYSILGSKYLQIGHTKNNRLLNPNLLILMYMGLFILGFLPRYHPELWNPFIRRDSTGEKFIIEKFLSICQRYIPNLTLNFIYGNRIAFVNETEGVRDLSSTITADELETMIKEKIHEMRRSGEIP